MARIGRLLPAIALVAVEASGCGGEGGGDVRRQATQPSPTISPTRTQASPTPKEPSLTAKDRKYLRQLRKAGALSQYPSGDAAAAAGKELCAVIERSDRRKGSVNVQLAPSWAELDVAGVRIPVDAFIVAIEVYCPKFGGLIDEYAP